MIHEDTKEEAKNSSGFTALHQAAYNNASPELVQKLVDLGSWRRTALAYRLFDDAAR